MIEPGRREEMELLRRLQEGEDFFKTRGGYFARNPKGENREREMERERHRGREGKTTPLSGDGIFLKKIMSYFFSNKKIMNFLF